MRMMGQTSSQTADKGMKHSDGRMRRMKEIHVNLLLCKYLSSGTGFLRQEKRVKTAKDLWGISQSPLTLSERSPSQQEADREEEAARKESDPDGAWKEPALLHRTFCPGKN